MPSYKLTYFNLRGRAEVIRILFHLAGVEYTDERIFHNNWLKVKTTTLTGQLPYLTVDGQILYQSYTIGRYLANKFGLAGKTDWEKAQCDMVVDMAEDMVRPLLPTMVIEKDPEKKKILRHFYETNQLSGFLNAFEKLLAEGGGDFFVGNEMTWADITVMHTIRWMENTRFAIKLPWDKYPKVKAFLSRMENIPKIAEYLAERPASDM